MDHRSFFAASAGVGSPSGGPPLTVIERSGGTKLIDVGEILRYKELLYCLVWREIKVRYKQTALGAAWAIIQPLMLMIVFSLFFRRVAGGGSSGVPYPLFVFTGLLPWTFFSGAVSAAGQSVVGQQNLITKVFFPRLILPMSSIGTGLVDLAVASMMLPPLMAYYGVFPGWGFWLFPLTVAGLSAAALGLGALLASLTVAYRDFRFVIPFLIQILMFATPAIYLQADAAPLGPRWSPLLALNPANGLIANLRASVLGLPPDYPSLAISAAVGAALLLAGCAFFHRQERNFADIV